MPKKRPDSDAEVTRTSSHVPSEVRGHRRELFSIGRLTVNGRILPPADDTTDRRWHELERPFTSLPTLRVVGLEWYVLPPSHPSGGRGRKVRLPIPSRLATQAVGGVVISIFCVICKLCEHVLTFTDHKCERFLKILEEGIEKRASEQSPTVSQYEEQYFQRN